MDALRYLKENIRKSITPLFEEMNNQYLPYIIDKKNISQCFIMINDIKTDYLRYTADHIIFTYWLDKNINHIIKQTPMGKKYAIRVKIQEFQEPEDVINLLLKINQHPSYYLILDFQNINSSSMFGSRMFGQYLIKELSKNKVNNIISAVILSTLTNLASSSLPKGIKELPCLQKTLYKSIKSDVSTMLIYGDYTVLTAMDYSPNDSTVYRGAEKIRYTLEDMIVCLKGSLPKKGKSEYPNMCNLLITQFPFKGKDFSFGDDYINACASKARASYGNATNWITNDINHHITQIVFEKNQGLL